MEETVRESGQELLAVVFIGALLVSLAFMTGITPDGLLHGQWAGTDDHPTNWADTVLHP